MAPTTLLPVIGACDNWRPSSTSGTIPFLFEHPADGESSPSASQKHTIGYVQPDVIKALELDNIQRAKAGQAPAWKLWRERNFAALVSASFADNVRTFDERCSLVAETVSGWRERGMFKEELDGWRDELYTIYGPATSPTQPSQPIFAMERAACALFGLTTFGVHLTAYTPDMRIWVPRRAKTKPTWPGYLDNSVAGGISHGYSPFDTIVKECGEEAGLDEALVKKHLKPAGAVSYFYLTKGSAESPSRVQPELQYIYDLALPSADIKLTPTDGEAESFELLSVEEILPRMHSGEFKPNTALVLIDFFIRHGIVTPENEPKYLEIVSRLHVNLGLPIPA